MASKANRSGNIWIILLFGIVCLFSQAASANEKYAAFVMHARTGEVLFDRYADAKRYPASLTKMMTLYMLFDELERGRFSLNSPLQVSAHAAAQPQTNLSLRKGQTIRVEDAIKALVVRSANDVAVVVAEAISGSEPAFGRQMTVKARQLGMRATTFRNASGLPDSGQVTTARDMATLGLALQRDFPKYYNYFSTKSFTFNGRTYHTHNHVTKRYGGADGIKTGYINASGFNLVTSAGKGGQRVIGVVMGGRTARSRDDHMIKLLDAAFADIRSEPRFYAGLNPKPVFKPALDIGTQMASANPAPVDAKTPQKAPIQLTSRRTGEAPVKVAARARARVHQDYQPPAYMQANYINASYGTTVPSAHEPESYRWGIQVGTYDEKRKALLAAAYAINNTDGLLSTSVVDVLPNPVALKGRSLHRARLSNLTEGQARKACELLISRKAPCVIYRDGSKES